MNYTSFLNYQKVLFGRAIKLATVKELPGMDSACSGITCTARYDKNITTVLISLHTIRQPIIVVCILTENVINMNEIQFEDFIKEIILLKKQLSDLVNY